MKPKYALVGVNPENMEVCLLAGWKIDSLKIAVEDGLIPIRTSWEKVLLIRLFHKITEEKLMELSE